MTIGAFNDSVFALELDALLRYNSILKGKLMHYDVMDLNEDYWDAMMDAFWEYSDNVDMWRIWYQTCKSKEFCSMYCGA